MTQSFNARRIAGVFILAMLTACSTPQTSLLLKSRPAVLPAHVELDRVKYFAQDVYQCGPATLAMVLSSAGQDIQPEQLKDELYIPAKQGSLQVEMLATARRHGMLAYQLAPSLQDVLDEITAGNPVIVLQNLSLPWFPMWHYAVAIGYDLDSRDILLRSGSDERLALPLTTFEHTWARSHYWAMVALPPGQIPQTAQPEQYIQSLQALAHSNKQINLRPAYRAAMLRWPDNLVVMIAAGNSAYDNGELLNAKQIFLHASEVHPDSPAALNNLAQILSDLGQYDDALQAVRQALKLGGPLHSVILDTQSEIERKKRAAEASAVK
jgi:tetratricopeptide (TPR) repeat protein